MNRERDEERTARPDGMSDSDCGLTNYACLCTILAALISSNRIKSNPEQWLLWS